jgi:NhaA family Na+:H+ antiporter
MPRADADRIAGQLSADEDVDAAEVREISFQIRESVPVAERLEGLLHPWTSYVIVPIFALANVGVVISADSLHDATTSRITLGVVGGLVVGKLVGVGAAIGLAVRTGLGRLPPGVTGRQVAGMAALAGIGFTVSLFVTGLAFPGPELAAEAKLGVIAASLVAASVGAAILLTGSRRPAPRPSSR